MSQAIFLGTGGGGGSGVLSVPTDSGTATPNGFGVLNIIAGVLTKNSGSTVEFTGSGNTVEFHVTDASTNTIIGFGSGTSVGASDNVGLGAFVLNNMLAAASFNVALGAFSSSAITTGSQNTAIGGNSLNSCDLGGNNTAIGFDALLSLGNGTNNTAIGYLAGSLYGSTESNNIVIGHDGVAAESGVTRIGTNGTQTSCYITGINTVNLGTANVATLSGDRLGSAVITAGTNIIVNTATPNEIIISTTGLVDDSVVTDSGTATPSGGILNLNGDTHNITTTGSGNTVNVKLTGITNHSLQVGGIANNLTQLGVASNGFLPIGVTAGNPILASLTSGTNINITNGAGSITVATSAAVTSSFGTDSGIATPIANQIIVKAGLSTRSAGQTVEFTGSTNIVQLKVTDGNNNTTIGTASGKAAMSGTNNTALGVSSGTALTTGSTNTIIGESAGASLTTGASNIALGASAGSAYTTESNNISIGVTGTAADSGAIRIGTNGTHTSCFVQGIEGNIVSNLNVVTIDTVTGKLGSQADSSISSFVGDDSSSAVPLAATIQILAEQASLNCGQSVFFGGFSGNTVLLNVSDTNANTIIGNGAGSTAAVADGATSNVGLGVACLALITSASSNTAIGSSALQSLVVGTNNIAIGNQAAIQYTSNETNNIVIGTGAITADMGVIRIGNVFNITSCFVQGIAGVAVTGAAVLVDAASGQLGVTVSSERYKKNIEEMGSYSDVIYDLKPVTFQYKEHASELKCVGLIAEQVHEVAPDLVVYDADNLPQTVKYQDLVPMLLNEVQKLRKELNELKGI